MTTRRILTGLSQVTARAFIKGVNMINSRFLAGTSQGLLAAGVSVFVSLASMQALAQSPQHLTNIENAMMAKTSSVNRLKVLTRSIAPDLRRTPLLLENPERKQQQYVESISDIEGDYGVYDSRLSQELLGLGVMQQNLGYHENAITSFKRAAHIRRVNEGLYSTSQVAIVERQIESHLARGEFEEADDKYDYLYRLHKRRFGHDDPRLLPVIDKINNWNLNAYVLSVGEGLLPRLIHVHKLYKLSVHIIEDNFGKDDPRLIDALHGLTVSNYYLAKYTGESSGFQVSSGAAGGSNNSNLQPYILNGYSVGKRSLSRVVDLYENNPGSSAASHARALVALGDWYLLFDKRQTAMRTYQRAFTAVQTSPDAVSVLQELFGQPVALPALPLPEYGNVQTKLAEEELGRVSLSFNVSAAGRPRNVKVVESLPATAESVATNVRRKLKSARFRPRFENGAAVVSEGIEYSYHYRLSDWGITPQLQVQN